MTGVLVEKCQNYSAWSIIGLEWREDIGDSHICEVSQCHEEQQQWSGSKRKG